MLLQFNSRYCFPLIFHTVVAIITLSTTAHSCHLLCTRLCDHPSIKAIKNNLPPNSSVTFRHTTEGEITKMIKSLNPKKATGPDQIPPKLIKIARPQISNVLTGMINNAIDEGIFPDSLKRAQVTPVFKKADNLSKDNYRPVSILPCLSKIFERVIANRLNEYFKGIFHESLSAFRSGYSCQDTLLALVEKWSQLLEIINVLGPFLWISAKRLTVCIMICW